MKNIQKIVFLSLIAAFCLSSNIFAQAETKTEIVIVKKMIDENGVETEEKITLTGKDAEKYIKEHDQHAIKSGDEMIFLDANGKELPAEVKKMLIESEVDIDEILNEKNEVESKSHLKVIEIDDDGNKKIIEWDGEGEMPTEIKELMGEHKVEGTSKMKTKKIMIIEEDIDVDIESEDGMKVIKIKKNKNGEESEEFFEIEESDEISQEIKDLLEEHGIDLDAIPEDGKVRINIEEENGETQEIHESHEIIVKEVIENDGPQNKAQLGVMIEDTHKGVKVVGLIDDGAAKSAGILENDIIINVDNIKVESADGLIETLSGKNPGDYVDLTIFSKGTLEKIKVQLKGTQVKSSESYRTEHKVLKIKGGDIVKCDPNELVNKKTEKLSEEEIEIIEEKITEQSGQDVKIHAGPNTLQISELDLFPNPTDGNIRVRFSIENNIETNVRIIDIAGRSVYEKNMKEFSGSFDEEIELPRNKLGTLVLIITQGNQAFTEKIILN